MKIKTHGLLAIQSAVLLFGAAGLFGKFIDLPASLIVFGRTFFASIALVLVLLFRKTGIRIRHGNDLFGFLLMGALLAGHWVTFFHSIQISTVAIALLTFSTFPIFVTFLEPFFFGEHIRIFDILISAVVFIGVFLVIPEFDFSNKLTLGAFWGTVSGFTFAVLSVLNRKYVTKYPSLTIAMYQNAVACLILLPVVRSSALSVTAWELSLLAVLGIVFTAVAHTLFIRGMLVIKAQLASVIACLEPVYGILLALAILHEVPSAKEILGGIVIIGAIVYATKRSNEPLGE